MENSTEDKTNAEDAQNFYCHLMRRIYKDKDSFECQLNGKDCKDKCECLEVKYESDEGEKIKNYLDVVVPKWHSMTPTRLYKHIQKMLENAEETRKFEIELIWKRVLCFIPLLVVFFTAFGFGFFETLKYEGNPTSPMNFILLFILSILNFFLSYLVVKINLEGQKWQENWEYHVDYLQAILGLNLMRTCLRGRTQKGNYTIGRSNRAFGYVICFLWIMMAFVTLLGGLGIVNLSEVSKMVVFSNWLYYILIFLTIIIFAIFLLELIGLGIKKTQRQAAETKESYFRSLEGLQIKKLKGKIKELGNVRCKDKDTTS